LSRLKDNLACHLKDDNKWLVEPSRKWIAIKR
jgi:hypothetical protein